MSPTEREEARLRTGQTQLRRAEEFAARGRDDLAEIQRIRAARNGVTAANAYGPAVSRPAGRDKPAIRGATYERANAVLQRDQFTPPPPSQMSAGGRGFIAPVDAGNVEGGNTGSGLPPTPDGMTVNPALRLDLETGLPYWEEPEGC